MKLRLSIFILFLSSCAFAPMNSSKTARPIGEHNTLMDIGFSPFPYVTLSSGVSERLTLAGSIEQQLFPLIAASARYSFQNDRDGFSFATEVGGSYGMGVVRSYSGFGGLIFSYKKDWFETYFYPKFNYVKFDKLELSSDDQADLFIDAIDPGSVTYILNALGVTFWIQEKIGLNLEAKYFMLLSNPGEVRHDIIPSIGLMIAFD